MNDWNQWVVMFGKIYRYSPKYHKDKEVYTLSQAIQVLKDMGYIVSKKKPKKNKNRRMI
jgi:hypothetical protein